MSIPKSYNDAVAALNAATDKDISQALIRPETPEQRSARKIREYATMYGFGPQKMRQLAVTHGVPDVVLSAAEIRQKLTEWQKAVGRMAPVVVDPGDIVTVMPESGPTRELMIIIQDIISEYSLRIVRDNNTAKNVGMTPAYIVARELIARFDAVAIMAGEPDGENGREPGSD